MRGGHHQWNSSRQYHDSWICWSPPQLTLCLLWYLLKVMAVDRDKYETEATEKNQNYYAVIEDVKLADMEIVEVQKQIIEVDAKLKSQQNMFVFHCPCSCLR